MSVWETVKKDSETRYYDAIEILSLALDFERFYTGLSIYDIMEKYNISRSTAIRRKDAINQLFDEGLEEVSNGLSRVKKWRLPKIYFSNLVKPFSDIEFKELKKCKSFLIKNKQSANQDVIEAIISKMELCNEKKLSVQNINDIIESEGFVVTQQPKYKVSLEMLGIISDCILAYKYVQFKFPSSKGGTRTIKVQPYGIVYGEKTYLLAYNEEYKQFRYYGFEKISDLRMVDEYFENDEDFDVKEYIEKSFGVWQSDEIINVKLLISKNKADLAINYHFHPTQKIVKNEDGTVTVTFNACGWLEMCWNFFTWGKDLEIIEPVALKDYYKNLLETTLTSIK